MAYAPHIINCIFTILLLLLTTCTASRLVDSTALPQAFPPGDHLRQLTVGGLTRSYLLHIPPEISPMKPLPVVLAFHGAATNANFMMNMTNLHQKADEAGFIVAYPNGTGSGMFLTFNAGGLSDSATRPNDVVFTAAILDDLATVVRVDPKRVYATGYSNGAMLCYRLAAELSDRIAAIAPVGGTMAVPEAKPTRPVSVLHFHGTADRFVPFNGPDARTPKFLTFKSVETSVTLWAKLDGCPDNPQITPRPSPNGLKITQHTYGPGKEGAEVILFTIEGGGHTWPGQKPVIWFIGKSTLDISANDLMWEFFQRHPMK